jgi:Uma2 family endonuclease
MTSLNIQLKNAPSEVYASMMRLRVNTQDYVYPDVIVVSGKPQLEDDHLDTLLNPNVIIEVLSPPTEQYDRGKKFQNYRTLPSLEEYLLVSQDTPRIERYLRQNDGQWLFSDTTGLEASLELPSIGCTLSLSDVYNKVTFETDSAE